MSSELQAATVVKYFMDPRIGKLVELIVVEVWVSSC